MCCAWFDTSERSTMTQPFFLFNLSSPRTLQQSRNLSIVDLVLRPIWYFGKKCDLRKGYLFRYFIAWGTATESRRYQECELHQDGTGACASRRSVFLLGCLNKRRLQRRQGWWVEGLNTQARNSPIPKAVSLSEHRDIPTDSVIDRRKNVKRTPTQPRDNAKIGISRWLEVWKAGRSRNTTLIIYSIKDLME